MQDVVFVARDSQSGERESDDHSDDTHQCAPETETQQDSSRSKPRDFTHNTRHKIHILEGLDDDENNRHQQQREPYWLTGLRRLNKAQQDALLPFVES